tara:strand:- start:8923 stop:9594 length:672 start_codon:yes stop_codon:yes gene_type:complete
MSKYAGRDRYGRHYGYQGKSAETLKLEEQEEKASDMEAMSAISDVVSLITTISTGMDWVSAAKEASFKPMAEATVKELAKKGMPEAGMKVFKETARDGKWWKNLLPDVRPVSERWALSKDVLDYAGTLDTAGKTEFFEKVRGLFSEEELLRLNENKMLDLLDPTKVAPVSSPNAAMKGATSSLKAESVKNLIKRGAQANTVATSVLDVFGDEEEEEESRNYYS